MNDSTLPLPVAPPTKVFLSYSRANIAVADELALALSGSGFAVLRDLQDILPAEDWKTRLAQLIADADAVVFLASEESAVSQVCGWEVEYAASLSKRIVPLVVDTVRPETLPPLISRLNLLKLERDASGKVVVASIQQVVDTDIAWVREHTRLTGAALRWRDSGSAPRLLLRGEDIGAAERWRDMRAPRAPEPTADTLAFITASRRGTTRRTRMLAAISAAVAVVTIGLAMVALENAREAGEQRDVADAQTRAAELRLADNLVILGNGSSRAGDPVEGKRRFTEARALFDKFGASSLPADLGWMAAAEASPDPYRRLKVPGSSPVTALGAAPDGSLIVAGDEAGGVTGWSEQADAPVFNVRLGGRVVAIGVPTTGDLLAVDVTGKLYAVARDGSAIREIATSDPEGGEVVAATAADNGAMMAIAQWKQSGDEDSSRVSVRSASGDLVDSIADLPVRIGSIAAGANAREYALGVVDGAVLLDFSDPRLIVGNLAGLDGEPSHRLLGAYHVTSIAMSTASRRLFSGGSDGTLDIHSVDGALLEAADRETDADKQREARAALKVHFERTFSGGITAMAPINAPQDDETFGGAAVLGFGNGEISVIDEFRMSFRWRNSLADDTRPVTAVVGYNAGQGSYWKTFRIAAGSESGTVTVFAPYDTEDYRRQLALEDLMPSVDFTADGRQFITVSPIGGGALKVVATGATQPDRSFKLDPSAGLGAARYASDQKHALVSRESGRLDLIDLADGTLTRTLWSGREIRALATAFGRDRFALLDDSGSIALFDDGREVKRLTFDYPVDGNPALSFDVDGARLLVSSGSAAQLLHVGTGKTIWSFVEREDRRISHAVLSPDGSLVAMSGEGGAVSVSRAATGKPIWSRPAHGKAARLAFTAAGDVLLSGGADGSLLVWRVIDGQTLHERSGMPPIQSIAISSRGTVALSVMGDPEYYGRVDVITLHADMARADANRRVEFYTQAGVTP